MTDIVNDLTAKTEKLAIDVKFDKNWCDMPPEIKLECIKVMDKKIRLSLRSTSKTEKALVDSQRYSLKKLSIHSNNGPTGLALAHILKTCDIENFNFYCDFNMQLDDQLEYLIAPGSIRVKRFYFDLERRRDFDEKIMFFLKKCWKNIELIQFKSFGGKIPFEALISIPSVTHAKVLRILSHWYSPLEVPLLAEKWIENDAKVGTILQMYYHRNQVTCELHVRKFLKKRVISNANEIIRIKTNNPAKHILMVYKDEGGYLFYGATYISVVIPSNLEESEYDRYTKLASF